MELREKARSLGYGIAIENVAFELQVLSERELGFRLPRLFSRGGDRRSAASHCHKSTMKAFGITYKESQHFRSVATLQMEAIASYVEVCTAAHKRATVNELLRLRNTTP